MNPKKDKHKENYIQAHLEMFIKQFKKKILKAARIKMHIKYWQQR